MYHPSIFLYLREKFAYDIWFISPNIFCEYSYIWESQETPFCEKPLILGKILNIYTHRPADKVERKTIFIWHVGLPMEVAYAWNEVLNLFRRLASMTNITVSRCVQAGRGPKNVFFLKKNENVNFS